MTPSNLLLSFGGIGFFPFAPGTAGSLATIPLLYLLGITNTPNIFIIPPLITTLAVSIYIINRQESNSENYQHDPSWIVIDEVVGMVTAWLFVEEYSWQALLAIFILFRFFDITKVWPANYFDRKMKSGVGVMIDDIVSAIYAGLLYRICLLAL